MALLKAGQPPETCFVDKIYVNQGLKRAETQEGTSGDIIALTGIKNAGIGDTITDFDHQEALPTIQIEEPALSMSIGPNTSPFKGLEGTLLASRQILQRIEKELATNVALKFEVSESGQYVISGRGELHLSVFLETLRREGFELEIGKPKVILKEIDGVMMEPIEELMVDVENKFLGEIKSAIGQRRGVLISQNEVTSSITRLIFEISTKNMLGLRGVLLTLSKGTSTMNSTFLRYEKAASELKKLRRGVLIASETGKTAPYGLAIAQDKGPVFVGPQTPVYAGMAVGINGRDEDMEINVCKEKQLTNNRSVGEEGTILTPPLSMSLEQYIGFLEDDELLEITPQSLRLRKKILDKTMRYRASRK